MNKAALKSPGFWISLISAIVGLLMSQGIILSGTTLYQVLGYVLALGGQLVGHGVIPSSAPAADTGSTPPPAAPTGN